MNNWKSLFALTLIVAALGFRVVRSSYSHAISWDVYGCYLYLPALFYFDDIELSNRQWADNLRKKYDASGTLYQVHKLENENFVIQYSCGQAVLMLPAFVAGHFLALAYGAEQDGMSWPYQLMVTIWSFLVAVLGLFYLRKLLMLFFNDQVTALTMLLMCFGTHYFIQISGGLTTSHTYLFALYTIFLYNVVLWHRDLLRKNLVAWAFALGLMCLTRPTDLLAILIPIFWNCTTPKAVFSKWKNLWKNNRKDIITIFCILFLCALPQLIYWKTISGHFVIDSYANPGEGLDLLSPHTLNFLFSYRKGLFIYTPLLLFALFGFVWLWRKQRTFFWPLFIFVLVNIYITSSWSCWWYAHCFSQRSVIQTLPVFAILVGFFILFLNENKTRKCIFGLLILICFSLNIFQSWQYTAHIIEGSRMTKDYYWAVFGKTHADPQLQHLLLINRSATGEMIFTNPEQYTSKMIYDFRAEDLSKVAVEKLIDSTNHTVQVIDTEHLYSEGWERKWTELTNADHNWLQVQMEFFAPSDFKPEHLCLVTCAEHKGGTYGYHAPNIHPDALKLNAWNVLEYDYLTPEIWRKGDALKMYAWYRGNSEVFIKELKIKQHEPIATGGK